jgi:hypothetical protein
MEIVSKLSAEELLKRIKNNVENLKLLTISSRPSFGTPQYGINPIVGRFKGNKFSLVKIILNQGNPFRPVFYGKVIPDEKGSVIRGEFKMSTFFKVLCSFFCGICLFILGLLVNQGVKRSYWNWDGLEAVGFMFAMFGFIAPRLGWYFEKDSVPAMIKFLNRCAETENKSPFSEPS